MLSKILIILSFSSIISTFTYYLEKETVHRIDNVEILCSDGYKLSGTIYRTSVESPGVLLLSPCGASRWEYEGLAQYLSSLQLNVMIVDMRGHGESPYDLAKVSDDLIFNDLNTIVDFFLEQPNVNSQMGIGGASCTVDFAFHLAHHQPRIVAIYANSGLTDEAGKYFLEQNPQVAFLGVASSQDEMMVKYSGEWELYNSADAITELSQFSPNKESTTWIYEEKGHANELFDVDPTLELKIAKWFSDVLVHP